MELRYLDVVAAHYKTCELIKPWAARLSEVVLEPANVMGNAYFNQLVRFLHAECFRRL